MPPLAERLVSLSDAKSASENAANPRFAGSPRANQPIEDHCAGECNTSRGASVQCLWRSTGGR
eukprot:2432558-Alexandrium_andersonii.AAC.1